MVIVVLMGRMFSGFECCVLVNVLKITCTGV